MEKQGKRCYKRQQMTHNGRGNRWRCFRYDTIFAGYFAVTANSRLVGTLAIHSIVQALSPLEVVCFVVTSYSRGSSLLGLSCSVVLTTLFFNQ